MARTEYRPDQLADRYESLLLQDVIPFWVRHGLDEQGGFFTYLDRDGAVYCTDKPVWLQGRIAWLFAHLYRTVEPREEWLNFSHRTLQFITQHGFDTDGRMFFLLTRDGTPLRKRRYLFSECFAVIAYAEYARITDDREAAERASELFDLIWRYHTTPALQQPKEFPQTRPSKGHAMPMILIATAQVLRLVDHRPALDQIAAVCRREILDQFCKPEWRVLLETVAPDGGFIDTPDGRCVNPGHAIETSWFLMREARRMGDPALLNRAVEILDWSLERGWDPEFGGLFYFTDVHGHPCVQYEWDMKLWWPHTEALVATAMAWRFTGDDRWLEWHERIHNWCWPRFGDPQFGEWYGYLHRDGSVSHRLKGNCWKGPFHLARALIRSAKILKGEWND